MRQHTRLVALALAAAAVLLMAAASGKINWTQINPLFRHGTGSFGQASDGTGASGHFAAFDANGNITDGGTGGSGTNYQTLGINGTSQTQRGRLNLIPGTNVTISNSDNAGTNSSDVTITASGGGGGGVPWLNVTNPTATTFAWRNQGGASINAGSASIWLSIPAAAGDNLRGREVAAGAAPFSITAGLVPLVHNQDVNQDGIYVTDGTKLITISLSDVAHGGTNTLVVNKWTNVTTYNSTPAAPGIGVSLLSPIFLKIRDDGTNISFYWSPDGTNFIQLYSEARLTFLASIADMGFYGSSANATWPTGVLLVSWATGT